MYVDSGMIRGEEVERNGGEGRREERAERGRM